MEARAILRYARISPRKVSIVMDLIRNKPLDEALAILQYTPLESMNCIRTFIGFPVAFMYLKRRA